MVFRAGNIACLQRFFVIVESRLMNVNDVLADGKKEDTLEMYE